MLDLPDEGEEDGPMACIASVPVLVCSQQRIGAVEFAGSTVVLGWATVGEDDGVARAVMIDDCVIDEQTHRVMSCGDDENRASENDDRCRITSMPQFCSSLDKVKARR